MRNSRCRSVFIALRQHDVDSVGGEHFKGAGQCRHRERMGVQPEKQRAIDLLLLPIPTNGLTDCEDMPLVKRLVE